LRDVWSLTQALLFPGNRLAWLAVLRSPYCGLALSDIFTIANFNKKKSIYYALRNLDKISSLTDEGQIRACFFIRIMHKALSQRYEEGLSSWIIRTLKALYMDDILKPYQYDDLEQFWKLLDRYEQQGRISDLKEFLKELNKLYSQQVTPSRLQIMTIHKSKGLEFDTVFLPGLGAQTNRGNNPLLRWLNLPTQKQGNLLLMSPIQSAHQPHCALYNYLSRLDEVKSSYETQRLLYVAVTRAKSRLYLTDHTEKLSKSSFKNLLHAQKFTTEQPMLAAKAIPEPVPKLMRLPLEYYQETQETSIDVPLLNIIQAAPANSSHHYQPSPLLSPGLPRLIGIVTHRLLQWICDNHPTSSQHIPMNLARYELTKSGLSEKILDEALFTIRNQLEQLFHDPIGSWLIAKQQNEFNEYELLVEHQGRIVTRIIDRTFEEHKKHWIIDFKTGKEDELTLKKYKQQLNEYGIYLSHLSTLPIHCGIYYLPTNHWVSWKYESSEVGLTEKNPL